MLCLLTSFDWSEALGLEEASIELMIEELRQAKNPGVVYEELGGRPQRASFTLPSQSEVVAFRKLILQAQEALRLPPSDAAPKLQQLQKAIDQSNGVLQRAVPSIVKTNESRAEVENSRANLLKALRFQ